jgi:transposase
MARSKNGEAISPAGRTPGALKKLEEFVRERKKTGNLEEWRRGRAVLRYIAGQRVLHIAGELDVTRGSVNRWLQWYEADGLDGLLTTKAPGPPRKLTEEQRQELIVLIEAGPIAAGYQSGVWTGPMVGDLIEQRYDVSYHKHNVPKLLHELGFSLQRPRKRLARADAEAQANWVSKRLPAIKKKRAAAVE